MAVRFHSRDHEQPSDEIVALARGRLHATLALVKSADAMPWPDLLSIIREDNAFRFRKDVLLREEGMAPWACSCARWMTGARNWIGWPT